jgi:DNA polymerase-3 subunit alpha
MKFAEEVGLIKYDFLGVSTLKAMSISLKLIAKRHKPLEWGEFPEDEKVYQEIFDKDFLEALFQVSGGAVRSVATKIKPRSIRQIALWISLMRPGAMDSPSPDPKDPNTETAATYYVKCAQGLREPYFIHEDLKPILGDTYGVIVTQEQALKLFRDLADYTYETAEEVRRGISKKDKVLMDKHVGALKAKLLARNWTEVQAQRLAESIIASARYSFNMAHAVSYAILAYDGAYLKYHYPLEFWVGELSINFRKRKKILAYLKECRQYIANIDIKTSGVDEWDIIDNKIIPPLGVVKGLGPAKALSLKNLLLKDISEVIENTEELEGLDDSEESNDTDD